MVDHVRSSPVLLRARGLTKTFGPIVAVRDLDLEVEQGSVHALVGPAGAGKTTVLNLVSGYVTADSGTVLLGGQDVTGLDPARLRQLGMGRCFAIAGLFDAVRVADYVRQVAARMRTGSPVDVTEVLDLAGLGREARLAVGALGLAQRRSLEVALTLAADPRIVILDEPSAGLGAAQVDRLAELLGRQRPGRAILLADHRLRLVSAVADRVSVLRAGRLAAQGSYAQVRRQGQFRAAYDTATD